MRSEYTYSNLHGSGGAAATATNSVMSSLCTMVVGLVFIALSVCALVWNEGRAVQTFNSLQEGLANVVEVSALSARANADSNEERLLHLTGRMEAVPNGESHLPPSVTDEQFGLQITGVHLERRVEMLQWKEVRHNRKRRNAEGREQTETVFSYKKEWSSRAIDSASFHDPSHVNPSPNEWIYPSQLFTADEVYVHGLRLSPSLLRQVHSKKQVMLDSSKQQKMKAALPALAEGEEKSTTKHSRDIVATSNALVFQGNSITGLGVLSAYPNDIGKIRITFHASHADTVSIIAQQWKGSLRAYKALAGDSIEILQPGTISAESMFLQAIQAKTMFTWILRGVGGFLMFLGWWLSFNPILTLIQTAKIFPFVGAFLVDVMSGGVFIVALICSFSLSLVIISISWIAYRPMLAVGLLVTAFVPLFGYFNTDRSQNAKRH